MNNTLFIVMGVSGCGKSTIGVRLSKELKIPFYDGDDFHPPKNVAKMESGLPLNDKDREPWLTSINAFAKNQLKTNSIIVACSALKHSYRKILEENINTSFIYLKGSFDLIQQRLKDRSGHFMPLELLHSQFDTLEEPENAIIIDISKNQQEIIKDILSSFG
jgi:6-phosphogluconate dehydrogenase